ncbi:MAG TPA: PaaI family thioesterase [Xanthobacteraceae bacterium]|nr:PaaI family thioesterase [Xanthobacteraceae bacterium]
MRGKPGVLSAAQVGELLAREFAQAFHAESPNVIEDAWHRGCRVRRKFSEHSLRPGGTISGPTMMALTDFAMYVAVLASVGPVPLAVTTSLNINFLRKPAPRDLIAEAKLIKLGKRLAVGDVAIYSDGEEEMVAHATATYSIPPPEQRGQRD